MSISEQVKELRGNSVELNRQPYMQRILKEAADTIESLSAKLQAANMECQKGNYSIGDLSELIDKFDNEKIKGITDFEQVQIFNALKYLDMYQKVGTIEKIMELKHNMEQSADGCDKWIYCGDGNNFPKEPEWYMTTCVVGNGSPFSRELYFDGSKFDTEEIEAEYYYTLCKVLAWQPLPEPYRP